MNVPAFLPAAAGKKIRSVTLAVVCLLAVTHSFAQKSGKSAKSKKPANTEIAANLEDNDNNVTYRGNKFVCQHIQPKVDADTHTEHLDETTGAAIHDPVPVTMNGKKIYAPDEVTTRPVLADPKKMLEFYIFKGISNDINRLPDGIYYLNVGDIVVDTKGKIVYFKYHGLATENAKSTIPADIKASIDNAIEPIMLAAPVFKPGKLKDKAVVVRTDIAVNTYRIVVKNHKTSIIKRV